MFAITLPAGAACICTPASGAATGTATSCCAPQPVQQQASQPAAQIIICPLDGQPIPACCCPVKQGE